jgi:hypothetical protein
MNPPPPKKISGYATDNSTFERMDELKYLGKPITDQNSVQREINRRLSQGMLAIIRCRIFCVLACYPKI